jgi:hypothetical protein
MPAEHWLAQAAVGARAAAGVVINDDAIAGARAVSGTDAFDDATRFMADGVLVPTECVAFGDRLPVLVQVRSAHGGRAHADDDFAWAGYWIGEIAPCQKPVAYDDDAAHAASVSCAHGWV